nr:hypothetical protein Iba_chr10cCG5920 [Ipomoea batatas]
MLWFISWNYFCSAQRDVNVFQDNGGWSSFAICKFCECTLSNNSISLVGVW